MANLKLKDARPTEAQCKATLNSVADALHVIGGKWKLRIIVSLKDGNRRFNEMQLIGVYAAEVLESAVRLNAAEHSEYEWLPLDECQRRVHFRGLKEGLRSVEEYITGVALESHTERVKHGRTWVTHRFRWISGVPLRDSKDALAVNWLEVEITDATGKLTYRNSFITDLAVDRNNAAERAAGGRARWKIENGSFNVMKTQGYNLEHSFGHARSHPYLSRTKRLVCSGRLIARFSSPLRLAFSARTR